jgi:aminopeptidase-like protein
VNTDEAEAGERMHALVRRLFPICRSITGDGLRDTLREIGRIVPLTIKEVPTGTPVLDWHVPREWNIRAARIETLAGEVLVDFDRCNLHVVGYSIPVDRVVSREELAGHVHTIPERPDVTPYRTAYYADTWGFCLPHGLWTSMRSPATG